MKTAVTILFLLVLLHSHAQQPLQRNTAKINIDTTNLNLANLTNSITGNANNGFQRAQKLLYWLSSNFDWLGTDYKNRSINEIIARGGGNCFELAKVYIGMIKAAGIKYRSVMEINIHPESVSRQGRAAKLVAEKGSRYSVFGFQHNDHRWVEIYNDEKKRWEPADPATGVIGVNDWLKARVWFGERKTIDTAISNQMIVPFAIFVADNNNLPQESRSAYYLIDQFDALYQHRLSKLSEWKNWTKAVNDLSEPAKEAFLSKNNLHLQQNRIGQLAATYQALKKEYLAKYLKEGLGVGG